MTDSEFLSRIDRRTFLRIVSITGAGGLVYPRNLLAGMAPLDLSRVVIVEDTAATSGLTIDAGVVQSMLNCGIMNLAEEYSIGDAWKSLIPGVNQTSVIAIKVNCINSSLSTHPEVANAVANSLLEMDFGGTPFPENNIIIYDRTNSELAGAGYSLNGSDIGVRCFGTDTSFAGYSTETYQVVNSTQRLSTIVTEMADYIVNLSVLKNHTISGVTFSLKNHYGTCNHPDYMHGGRCSPYIPALNALPAIRDKNVVNICDGLFGISTGGPMGSPQFAANSLIMGRDIVAVDYQCREILAANGCNTIGISGHVDTAAADPYNLGTNDPAAMDVVTLSEPAGTQGVESENGVVLKQNSPNPFTSRTNFRFFMPRAGTALLAVYDPSGRRVRRLVDGGVSAGWHDVAWDGLSDSGRRAAAGVYFCRLKTKGFERAVIMQMVR
jgi:uncharacterized protein (DUF362 family)